MAKIGELHYDGLITDLTPKTEVRGKTVRKRETEGTLLRGTLLAMSSGEGGDGKLVILGSTPAENETLTPDCILCDDLTVGTEEDVAAAVYTAGCFDPTRITFESGYNLTAADYDTLRKYGIVFKEPAAVDE